ncbi:hypothetical protein DFQ27_005429 [Actinomortierella ambigua]|uniref:Uncharacterized protein n=1 Tax=Actinomortierella ambigua TaxID=1343610 RepID=A0A9P6PZ20_9FUNG|nr:hypothetical protein DFQ27_005429 [Actinomortierella ambigua]
MTTISLASFVSNPKWARQVLSSSVVPQGWVEPPPGDDDEDAIKDSLLSPPPRSSSLAPTTDY